MSSVKEYTLGNVIDAVLYIIMGLTRICLQWRSSITQLFMHCLCSFV